ncbi:hypothetical protein ACKLNQ_05800 [Myroides odoratimimus]|uniref:hypothetical protein n=1 Tax=Myroides odoratimimus TaxID=76832 RepID=UPI0038D38436
MRNFLCVWLLFMTSSLFANSFVSIPVNDTLIQSDIKQESKSKKKRDLKEKLTQMDGYIACNFTQVDETQSIADGNVFMSPEAMTSLKKFVMKDRNVLLSSIFIISAYDSIEFGEYEVCAGGIYYKYYNSRVDKREGYSRNK